MINAAIVGLGWWGRIIHRELSSSKVIRPVLGIDPSDAAREGALAAGLATSARFEDALARDDIDAVILCTPHKHHAGQIVAAAQGRQARVLREAALHVRQRDGGRRQGRHRRQGAARHRP